MTRNYSMIWGLFLKTGESWRQEFYALSLTDSLNEDKEKKSYGDGYGIYIPKDAELRNS